VRTGKEPELPRVGFLDMGQIFLQPPQISFQASDERGCVACLEKRRQFT
jgi:hypothetical protein